MAKIRGGAVKPATPEQLIGHYNTQAFTLQQQKDAEGIAWTNQLVAYRIVERT
jgi:hypothetical protein